MVLILVLGVVYYFYADHFYDNKMAGIDRQVDKIIRDDFPEFKGNSRKRDQTVSLRTHLNTAKKKLKELKESSPMFAGGQDNVVDVMYQIAANLPSKSEVNFEVQEFAFATDFVRLNASTTDTLNVEKIVAALEKTEYFTRIESTDAQPKPGNIWDFTLKLSLKKTE